VPRKPPATEAGTEDDCGLARARASVRDAHCGCADCRRARASGVARSTAVTAVCRRPPRKLPIRDTCRNSHRCSHSDHTHAQRNSAHTRSRRSPSGSHEHDCTSHPGKENGSDHAQHRQRAGLHEFAAAHGPAATGPTRSWSARFQADLRSGKSRFLKRENRTFSTYVSPALEFSSSRGRLPRFSADRRERRPEFRSGDIGDVCIRAPSSSSRTDKRDAWRERIVCTSSGAPRMACVRRSIPRTRVATVY